MIKMLCGFVVLTSITCGMVANATDYPWEVDVARSFNEESASGVFRGDGSDLSEPEYAIPEATGIVQSIHMRSLNMSRAQGQFVSHVPLRQTKAVISFLEVYSGTVRLLHKLGPNWMVVVPATNSRWWSYQRGNDNVRGSRVVCRPESKETCKFTLVTIFPY